MRDLVSRSAPLPVEDAVNLIKKIADGLNHCHENGIIHRDLKPENILMTSSGQPVIMDFGLALTKNAHRVTYANLSSAAGTPDYMSPEQIEGHRGDQRTDIYALGIMFYELLKGEVPFHGDNNLAVMAQHLQHAVPRLDKEIKYVSPQIAAIVAKCLQKDPDHRYKTVKEFLDELENQEGVDITILDRVTGLQSAAPFWRSPVLKAIGSGFLILLILAVLALILQSFHK
jgi:serine/threonine-protein kinase